MKIDNVNYAVNIVKRPAQYGVRMAIYLYMREIDRPLLIRKIKSTIMWAFFARN